MFIQNLIKRHSVVAITLVLTPVVVALSFGVYMIVALTAGILRPVGIFWSIFIPAVLVPAMWPALLGVTRSLYRTQDELLKVQEELEKKVLERTEELRKNREMEEKLQHTMARLRTLSHRLLEIQETERRYIARELHDEIGQALTALRMGLKRTEGSKTLEAALVSIHENTPTLDDLIQKVRNLSIELRPSILDDFGLTAALDWYTKWLSAKVGFKVVFYADFTEERFSPILELTCFRITQEALTNAARHSGAKVVYVDLETMGEELHLTVRDDGKGFNIDETRIRALKGESFGLLGMHERASLAGGHLELTSEPGKGTVVHASFPLESKAADQVKASASI